jgi:AbrB family looped-hinge helix DNA binding protein
MTTTMTTMTKQGSVEIPSELRERFGLHEGSVLAAEAGEEGILLRPTELPEVEIYTPERIAEFLLGNAIDEEDYDRAVEEVRKLGLDPAQILHDRPHR